jgi:vacuolar-type H+-ATPase subunit I/STV1
VCDNTDSDEQKKLETIVFKAEKVALAMKAFRTVRMDSTQVAADPLLADQGKESPRLLLINPEDGKVTVLEKNKLSGSAVFNALEHVSDKFYVQKLEKTVKSHLDLLTEQDQLANKEKKLNEDQARVAEDGKSKGSDAKAKKELDEIKDELKGVRDELKELSKKQSELWKLTPKSKAEAA